MTITLDNASRLQQLRRLGKAGQRVKAVRFNGNEELVVRVRRKAFSKAYRDSDWETSDELWDAGGGSRVCPAVREQWRLFEPADSSGQVRPRGVYGTHSIHSMGETEERDFESDVMAAGEVLHGHGDMLRCLAVSRDGTLLAAGFHPSAGNRAALRVWRLPGAEELVAHHRHRRTVAAVALCPDGRRVASAGGPEYSVLVTRLADGEVERWLKDHKDDVNALAFPSDGVLLASADAGGKVLLWDMESGQCLGRLQDHTDAVNDLCFSPDGKLLASASDDGFVMLWGIP